MYSLVRDKYEHGPGQWETGECSTHSSSCVRKVRVPALRGTVGVLYSTAALYPYGTLLDSVMQLRKEAFFSRSVLLEVREYHYIRYCTHAKVEVVYGCGVLVH